MMRFVWFVLAGLLLVLFIRFSLMKKRYGLLSGGGEGPAPRDSQGFSERFSRLIRIPTISWTDRAKRDTLQFKAFQEILSELYPNVHAAMEREVFSEFGMVLRWPGKNPDETPALFLAHYDVVPAEERGGETWEIPPFSGEVADNILWGRGTLDIKCMIALYMEAAETLITRGWQPRRDLYFAFGGDEEIGGLEGAAKIAAAFREKGMRFEFIMDEGGIISKEQMAFLRGRPAALVGLAEKGFVTFKLRTFGQSGHSSMPEKNGTAIGRLARGVARMERSPFPSRLDPVLRNMLERFVPFVTFPLGIIFANLWLFSPLVRALFARNKVTDSLIRTTQAVTVFHAGEQENILPGEAACLTNHRILPGVTKEQVKQRIRKILRDPGILMEDAGKSGAWPANDPVPAKVLAGPGFERIRKTLSRTHPDAVTVPFLVNGGTDSKYYADLTDEVLRFCPLTLTPSDVASIHGVNEKVSLDNLARGIEFFIRLFKGL